MQGKKKRVNLLFAKNIIEQNSETLLHQEYFLDQSEEKRVGDKKMARGENYPSPRAFSRERLLFVLISVCEFSSSFSPLALYVIHK